MQEVLRTSVRNQFDELLDGTGLHSTHQADVLAYSPPWADRYGGSAVASRWPHQMVEVLDLPLAGAVDVPWCALAVSVPVPGEGEMLFIAAISGALTTCSRDPGMPPKAHCYVRSAALALDRAPQRNLG